ncbi:hypothetical protein [Laribacter hongkongensis]|uniref:hypothetical protein n=1 Tax=Laribacter hongkongensis TaxID=168471 RepID=UPI001EFCE5C2|nr:hypothetical protein [Laribacter hongkongensis]MCG9040005.1 hypothetical protein [Laribacter hongkongensis]MCG9068856.1 hypothetical protein [Laribacter hongkongensis]
MIEYRQQQSAKELKEQRFEALIESCQQEVLKQIIGPFGLTKAMFEDVDGGSVTTTHNFELGVTANEADQKRFEEFQKNLERTDRTLYDKDLPSKRKEMFQTQETIHSAYTGNELTKDGQTHLDHVVPAAQIERDARANLFMDPAQRAATANHDDNLVAAESSINQSMGDKNKREWADQQRKNDPGKTNAESFGVDREKLDQVVDKAEKHVQQEILKAQVKKHGTELLATGAQSAAKNALRQAMGVLLHEFVSGTFLEIKKILKTGQEENIVDQITKSLKRVMERVASKLKHAWNALVQGGVQGFLSNFLTYLINCLVTTSAKVVTIIREGMMGLWKAIKTLINPPKGMSTMDAAREASKIIAGVVTMGLGMLLEESVKGFIISFPLLAPLGDIVATAATGIMTGIMTALVVYGIDRLFDWLSSSDTALLESFEHRAANDADLVLKLGDFLDAQFQNSRLYDLAVTEYRRIHDDLAQTSFSLELVRMQSEETIAAQQEIIESYMQRAEKQKLIMSKIDSMVDSYSFRNQK